jgi:hypothetical protein
MMIIGLIGAILGLTFMLGFGFNLVLERLDRIEQMLKEKR